MEEESNKKIEIELTKLNELMVRFESTLRMYKFVVNNPKHFDRVFHMREIEHIHKYLQDSKKELINENSNN